MQAAELLLLRRERLVLGRVHLRLVLLDDLLDDLVRSLARSQLGIADGVQQGVLMAGLRARLARRRRSLAQLRIADRIGQRIVMAAFVGRLVRSRGGRRLRRRRFRGGRRRRGGGGGISPCGGFGPAPSAVADTSDGCADRGVDVALAMGSGACVDADLDADGSSATCAETGLLPRIASPAGASMLLSRTNRAWTLSGGRPTETG